MRSVMTAALAFCLIACGSGPNSAGAPLPPSDVSDDSDGGIDDSSPDGLTDDVLPPAPCLDNADCDDGDPCTTNDRCSGGECVGTPNPCDDGMPCTRDICDGKGGCHTELIAGTWCLIGGDCVEDGENNPANPCEACVTPINSNAWTPSDGGACDDGLDCTAGDLCLGGLCRGTTESCDDNNPCTTNGCKEGQGCIHAAIQGSCEDGDLCTLNDYCNNMDCVPGNQVLVCTDGDPCTQDDCSANGGCEHIPHSGPCNDGNPCTANDSCILGECISGTQQPDCNDVNPCTSDVCMAYIGCVHIPNLDLCEDGDTCSLGDTCSNGSCLTGLFQKDCDDDNSCTLDQCEPFKGCSQFPQVGACEDGNPCTSGDICTNGYCKGTGATNCDDDDACTDDVCDAKVAGGCTYVHNAAPCEDGNLCTEGDTCANGTCVPNPKGCDDENPCTMDVCDDIEGCEHTAAITGPCQLKFVITSPKRAVTLTGNQTVTIKGKVISPVTPVALATLNGVLLQIDAQGKFTTTVTATHGMNTLEGYLEDEMGNTKKAGQSFYFSSQYQPMNENNAFASSISKALYLFMGQEVIDDGDHSITDPDDLATIVEILLGSFDIAGLIPNPAVENGEYKVVIKNLTYEKPKVALTAQNGGLHFYAAINNTQADVDADGKCFFCPNLSGNLSIAQIIITANLNITMKNGDISVTLTDTDVIMVDADIDISGILGTLFDFLVDWIVGGFISDIEQEFEDTVGEQIPETLGGAFDSLAFSSEFKFGPFFEGGPQGTVNFTTGFESTYWVPDGGTFQLWGAALSPKNNNKSVLGSLLRDACMSGGVEALQLPMEDALQIAVSDDLFNQILFAAWRTGVFELPVPQDLVDPSALEKFGISDMDVTVDLLLPPVITSCNPNENIMLQMGDINVHAIMTVFGNPVEFDIYASAEAYVDMVTNPEGFGIEIGDFSKLITEVVVLSEEFTGAADFIESLLGDEVVPNLFSALNESAIGGFPIPAIDLSGLADGIPEGTELAIDVVDVYRDQGWTVATGGVQ